MGFTRLGIKKTTTDVFRKTTDPGPTDDNYTDSGARGHEVGDLWVNTVNDRVFQCVDTTAGAAVWRRLGSDRRTVAVPFDATDGVDADQAIGLGVTIPAGSFILNWYYHVVTTFVSATDACTLAVTVESTTPETMVAAAAISGVGDVWDAGDLVQGATADGTIASAIEPDSEGELTVTLAGSEALTAGKMFIVVDYIDLV